MKRKRLFFPLGGIILCFAMLTTGLLINGLAHSHAAGPLYPTTQSHTSARISSLRSFVDTQNNIYLGTTHGSIYALNNRTGTQLWQYRNSADTGCDPNNVYIGISIYRVTSGIVYVNPCESNTATCLSHLIALRISDGSQLWCSSFPLPQYWNDSVQILEISGGIIYLVPGIYCGMPSFCNGTLYALNAKDGSLLWSYNPPSSFSAAGFSYFQLLQGVIYLSVSGLTSYPAVRTSQICALNANDGSQHWCVSNVGEIAFAGGEIYATETTSSGSVLTALKASDGSQIWSYPGSFNEGMAFTNAIYAVNNTSICMFSSDGSPRWCVSPINSYFTFQVQGGIIYVSQYPPGTAYSGATQAFSSNIGTLLWTKQNSGILALDQGISYLVTTKARVEAVHATDGSTLWSYKFAQSGSVYFSQADKVIYYNTPHELRVLSASTGALLWSHFSASTVNFNFQGASNGIAYAESNNTTTGSYTLNAFDASNGILLWKYAIVCVGSCL